MCTSRQKVSDPVVSRQPSPCPAVGLLHSGRRGIFTGVWHLPVPCLQAGGRPAPHCHSPGTFPCPTVKDHNLHLFPQSSATPMTYQSTDALSREWSGPSLESVDVAE